MAQALTPTELKLQDAILDIIVSTYRTDRGETIQGQSISYLSTELRERRWKNVSHLSDLESTAERLGFKIVRAQGLKGSGKFGPFARVVTL